MNKCKWTRTKKGQWRAQRKLPDPIPFNKAIWKLSVKQRAVLFHLYVDRAETYDVVAKKMNISKQAIWALHKGALHRLENLTQESTLMTNIKNYYASQIRILRKKILKAIQEHE
jgi:predicted DNA-binding protein YlxM (UPF0122 family)